MPNNTNSVDGGKLAATLNRKLFDIPSISPVHETPRTGLFRSLTIRLLWVLWTKKLSVGGRFFLLASGLFFGYGATSLELQAFVPLAYTVGIWVLAIAALALERPRVALKAHHAHRIASGQNLEVDVEVSQEGKLSSGGLSILPNALPARLSCSPPAGINLPALLPGAQARAHFTLTPNRRGIYNLNGYRVETDFPFGLINTSKTFPELTQLTVYPRFDPLERLVLPRGRRYQPGGVAFAAPRGESLEYVGNRDYREGDDVRHIDWRSTARLNRPIVREYREEYFLRTAIILDTHVPQQNETTCDDFERAVSLCAACGDYMNRADYLVDILAAGPDLHHLRAGRGLATLDQVLDILACVEPSSTPAWKQLEPELLASLEQITSIICLFLDWNEERRAFATTLVQSGAAVKVVIVRRGNTTMDPHESWPGEVPIVGNQEWSRGVTEL